MLDFMLIFIGLVACTGFVYDKKSIPKRIHKPLGITINWSLLGRFWGSENTSSSMGNYSYIWRNQEQLKVNSRSILEEI